MADAQNNRLTFLKYVMLAGGVYEAGMGLVMLFLIRAFFPLLGADVEIDIMMFPRSMGMLALCFGLLMMGAARDPERYILVPLVSIILRVLIQFPIVAGIFEMPEMALPLIGFGAFDLAFAILTAYAIKRSGIEWKKW